MKGPSGGSGGEPQKPALPIDIHFNKLLDWLIDRRHCNVNWATDAGTLPDAGGTVDKNCPFARSLVPLVYSRFHVVVHRQRNPYFKGF